MPYDDLFNPEEQIHLLKVEIEDLKTELADHRGLSNVILKQRQELVYLLKESGFYMHAFEATMPPEDFKKCADEGKKEFEDWIKKEFEIGQINIKATVVQP